MCRKRLAQLGVSEEDSKDIYQESVILLYEKLQDQAFALHAKVSTYLYSVCERKGLEHHRQQKRKTALSREAQSRVALSREALSGEMKTNPTVEDATKMPDDEQIRTAIQSLGYPCKELLAAFYYHKEKLKDLYVEMGYSSENTAKQAKFKCMKRLKKNLTLLVS
jgi:RNA polymerase sigma factor (sigma-70 family)